MYLFDTSAVIDWLYSDNLKEVIKGPVSISVITLIELYPAAKMKGKKSLNALESFFSQVEIIETNEKIAKLAAETKYKLKKKGKDKSILDVIIASTAKENDLLLVTYDGDFEQIGEVLDIKLQLFVQK